jgi:hypothetical protein
MRHQITLSTTVDSTIRTHVAALNGSLDDKNLMRPATEFVPKAETPSESLDVIVRKRAEVTRLVSLVAYRQSQLIGALILIATFTAVVCAGAVMTASELTKPIRTAFITFVVVVGGVTGVLGLFSLLSVNGDTSILKLLNDARANLTPIRSRSVTMLRRELDSVIAHVTGTPTGYAIFGVLITADVVRTVGTLGVTALSIVVPQYLSLRWP